MKRPRVSEAEWEVMEVLWENAPLAASDVVEKLAAERQWAANTIRTMLARLSQKKAVAARKLNGVIVYRPLFTRDDYVQHESDTFLNRVFGGAAKPLLLHFVSKTKLTPAEIRELQKILEDKGRKS